MRPDFDRIRRASWSALEPEPDVLNSSRRPGGHRGSVLWYQERDSNPHGFPRRILSAVRLPIPPSWPAEARLLGERGREDSRLRTFEQVRGTGVTARAAVALWPR